MDLGSQRSRATLFPAPNTLSAPERTPSLTSCRRCYRRCQESDGSARSSAPIGALPGGIKISDRSALLGQARAKGSTRRLIGGRSLSRSIREHPAATRTKEEQRVDEDSPRARAPATSRLTVAAGRVDQPLPVSCPSASRRRSERMVVVDGPRDSARVNHTPRPAPYLSFSLSRARARKEAVANGLSLARSS